MVMVLRKQSQMAVNQFLHFSVNRKHNRLTYKLYLNLKTTKIYFKNAKKLM